MVNILGFVGWSLGLCPISFLLCYLFIFVESFKNVKTLLSSAGLWATICRGLLRNSRVGCGLTLGAKQYAKFTFFQRSVLQAYCAALILASSTLTTL